MIDALVVALLAAFAAATGAWIVVDGPPLEKLRRAQVEAAASRPSRLRLLVARLVTCRLCVAFWLAGAICRQLGAPHWWVSWLAASWLAWWLQEEAMLRELRADLILADQRSLRLDGERMGPHELGESHGSSESDAATELLVDGLRREEGAE